MNCPLRAENARRAACYIVYMEEFARSFYGSVAWQRVRAYVKQRDKYLCQDCLKKGIYKPADEVHHIQPLTPDNIEDPEISLNADNLVSLCKDCHEARHTKREKRYKVDEFGKVTIL